MLAKGFAGTSIDELIAAAGITKSGFFYHFKDKAELAKALLLRYLEHDQQVLDDLFNRADELNEDPLHGFLVGLKLFAEMMANMTEVHPGCLAASFVYQDQLFNREVRDLNAEGILRWRRRFRERLDLIAERYPPRDGVDLDALADMAATLIEGALIFLREGLVVPAEAIAATTAYRDEMDRTSAFCRDCITVSTDGRIRARHLYDAYCNWAVDRAERPVSETRFGKWMASKYQREESPAGRHYVGIALHDVPAPPSSMPERPPTATEADYR